MSLYRIYYTHNGVRASAEIEAPDHKAAKKVLYAQLGVKRLVGCMTETVR